MGNLGYYEVVTLLGQVVKVLHNYWQVDEDGDLQLLLA